jgi:hypothetical protein
MSIPFTSVIPRTILFLESDIPEGTDLNNYILINYQVQNQDIGVYHEKNKVTQFIDAYNNLQNIQEIPWITHNNGCCQSIESQGNNTVLTGNLEDMYPQGWPRENYLSSEDLAIRLQIYREFGFDITITEQEFQSLTRSNVTQ